MHTDSPPHARRTTRSTVFTSGVFVLACFLVYGFIEFALTQHHAPLLHTAALTAITSICVLPILTRRNMRANPFHLFSYYLLHASIGFAFGAVTFHFGWINVDVPSDIFVETAFVATISLALLYLGFRLPIGTAIAKRTPLLVFSNDRPNRPDIGWDRYLTGLAVLYAAGWGTRMIGAALGYFHSGDGQEVAYLQLNIVWTVMPVLSTVSFMIVIGLWLDRRINIRMPPLLPIGFIVLEVLAGAVNGSRSQMLMPLLLTLIVYNYTRKMIGWRYLVIGFLILIFAFLPAATIYRNIYRTNVHAGRQVSIDTATDAASQAVDQADAVNQAFGQALARLTVRFQGLGRVLNRVPERYRFQRGDTFVEGMYMSFVPRIIYPQKGFYNPTRRYGVLFYDNRESSSTSNSITVAGELYYNYGYIGLLGLIVLGVFFRFFWERFILQSRVEFMPFFRLHFLLFGVLAISTLATYPAGLTRTAIVYYLGMILLHRRLPTLRMPSTVSTAANHAG